MPKYSQHFLKNSAVAEKIIRACDNNPGDYTVEIGPGKGILTRELLKTRAGKFSVVEIDPAMVNYLRRILPDSGVNIVEADFLEIDLPAMLRGYERVQFAGNLPYDVASPILQKILGFEKFHSAVLMFQKEVAERIVASPDTSKYGVLSLSVQSRSSVKKILAADRFDFNPPPKVQSAAVEFAKLNPPVFSGQKAQDNFFKTIKAAFMHRRKTILNSLALALGLDKKEAESLISKAAINPANRPQAVDMQSYIRLSEIIFSGREI
ncbi:MAG: 16S rRNA (adenine(1518)-N(6)/adenine(1519)-N(6))-dimethyltransferase RsmA [Elusimicrobia bacterium]|nr:16S rRNA (adenine(1518)-N(6)/adenine(1519)-N(6))-dimethyltransferase RsmA [Elusimicrobiota bacterium]